MDELKIGGKEEKIWLNGHLVTVVRARQKLSYEEGVRRIDKILEEAKKSQKKR